MIKNCICIGAVFAGGSPSVAATTSSLFSFATPPARGEHYGYLSPDAKKPCWKRPCATTCPPLRAVAAETSGRDVEIPRSSVLVRDEAAGCDIYLVGCLHGSPASGRDVQHVMDNVRPGAVVLELCESRHKSLRRDLEKGRRGDVPLEGKERWSAAFKSWAKGIKKTAKKAGVLQAALAGALSAPYLLQRLGNFDPGLEFKIAMAYADASAISSPNSLEGGAGGVCDVVLGDRDVQETLRRLGGTFTELTRPTTTVDGTGREGGGPMASIGMVGGAPGVVGKVDNNQAESPMSDWAAGVVADARVVQVAISGPSGREWPESLQVSETVWRERRALGALLLPMMAILYTLSVVFQTSFEGAASAATAAVAEGKGLGLGGVFDSAVGFGSGAGVGAGFWNSEKLWLAAGDVTDTLFLAASAWFMLRFFRLVIKERDDVLAASIIKTCRDHPGRPVVAVLGLLHCNGVAEIIRNTASSGGGTEHEIIDQ